MRVCFFIPSFGDGGAQRQCIALLNEIQGSPEVEIHLILLGSGAHEASLMRSAISVHRTEVRNFGSPRALLFVISTIWRVRPQVLISWLHPADIWSYIATRIFRSVKWVLTERNSSYVDRPAFNLRRKMGQRAAALIVANSEAGARYWRALDPRGSVIIVPNMVIEPVVAASSQRTVSTNLLCVGRLEPEKNVVAVVAAFAAFACTEDTSVLNVVGQGSQSADLERAASKGAMPDRVNFLGFRHDISRLMEEARLLLTFSCHEGMPNVLMEAVAAGLPAVVSDIPEHRALLGADYPYYVSLDASVEEQVAVISAAWIRGLGPDGNVYLYALNVLDQMAPKKIGQAYLDAFCSLAPAVQH